jgi:hypothetical protein
VSLCDTTRHPQRQAGTHLEALEHLGDVVEDLGGGRVVAGRGVVELPEVHAAHTYAAVFTARSSASRVSPCPPYPDPPAHTAVGEGSYRLAPITTRNTTVRWALKQSSVVDRPRLLSSAIHKGAASTHHCIGTSDRKKRVASRFVYPRHQRQGRRRALVTLSARATRRRQVCRRRAGVRVHLET